MNRKKESCTEVGTAPESYIVFDLCEINNFQHGCGSKIVGDRKPGI